MANYNFTIEGNSLVMRRTPIDGDTSYKAITFKQPSLVNALDKIRLFEAGEFQVSLLFTDFGLIDGVSPTDLEDAEERLLVMFFGIPVSLNFITSNEDLSLANRKDDVLYGILDQYTGEEISLSKTTDLNTADGIIYFDLGIEKFKRNYTGGVNAKWFGAKGDDSTNDTVALQKWLTYAGELYLPDGVYLANNQLQIFSRLSINGTGTIKRANMVSTTTATNITTATNPTAITVADASQFSVGMFVTVTTGVNNLDGCYTVHVITSKVGNVITVNNNFTRAFPSGGTVVSHHALLTTYLTPDEVKIEGITLDGNRANNTLYASWQVNSSLYVSTTNGYVKNCKIINSQADGILVNGSNFLVDGNYINNSGGNALHLSGLAFSTITNNKLTNANMANVLGDNNSGAGHSEGLITWSELISDVIVDGNYFDTGRSIIGGIGGSTNNDIQFINNVCKNGLYFGIEVTQSSATPEDGKNFIIANNKFFSCKQLYFNNSSGSGLPETMGIKNIIINGNHLVDTSIYSNRAKYMVITNNIIEQNVNTAQNIYMDNYQHLNISANTIKGGGFGVYLASAVKSGTLLVGDQVSVSNNLFTNQKDYGIFFATSAGKMHSYISVQNNNIFNAGTNNSYIAIQTIGGTTVKNNNINVVTNGKGINCIGDSVASPVGIQGAIVLENNILVPAGGSSYSVNIAGGVSKCVVKFNTWSRDISNAEPLYNIVGNNYIFGDYTTQTIASSATVTPISANDIVTITAQATGLTLANPTGVFSEGQVLMIRIKDNGTARSIAFGSNYRAIGVTLPITTVISKILYLRIVYNSTDVKWDVLQVSQEV